MLLAPLSRSVVHKASRALLVTRCQFSITCCCRAPELARGSYSKVTGVDLAHFRSIVGNNMLTDTTDMQPYNTDWLRTRQGKSAVVLRPHTTQQVCQILEYCNDRNLAVVPQGGNTGLVGGSNPVFDEIIVSVSLMNKIISLDEAAGILTCEAGCVLESLDAMLSDKGLVMPLDLASKGSCQIGGNVSTNAGGIRFIRYGSLHGSVLGIKAVLADGSILDCLSPHRKNNTGYDLKQLFIGAEGTLGVITEVAIAVPPKPKAINVALVSIESFDKAKQIVVKAKSMLSEILSAIELMDDESVEMVVKQLNLVNPLKRSPFYMLIETSGSDYDHDKQKLHTFIESVFNDEILIDGTVASSIKEMKSIWKIREEISNALMIDGRNFLHFDLSLSLSNYYRIVDDLRNKLPACTALGFGHIGDGNLHLTITSDSEIDINSYVLEWTKRHGGSISAEHGLGFDKCQYIYHSQSQKAVSLMSNIKKLFDPKGILNPYKTLPL
ncbi:D-2-hydroxyglutarate dehydrogenase, mitochondrial-like [Dysidea avara]|uniref:D-2-hydroxyglutarate dehydrogenase, mitochondrial-like n=1 Tax=Dysidea avara TaxID=196820 RepID=UPI0033328A20